ncbi:MAG TPA: YhjD/YihY/BrkB family envelope integrity protein [Micromonosporaceae bacterium]
MSVLDRIEAGFGRGVDTLRRRSRYVDHVWRAGERFVHVNGGRLAAAISYYAFFAAFSLGVLAYSIIGRLLGPRTEGGAVSALSDYLETNLPWVAPTARDVGQGQVTLFASLALLVSGIGWVEALRSSLRAVWRVHQHPGHWLLRRLVDLGVLAGLGVLLGLSLATTDAIDRLLAWASPDNAARPYSFLVGPVLEFGVNMALAAALLTGVARLRLSPRRLLPAALVIAAGIQVLNTVGRLVIRHSQQRPAYAVVAGAVGLLIYLYLLNQVILFGAALAATARAGTAVDLGRGAAGIGRGEAVGGQT